MPRILPGKRRPDAVLEGSRTCAERSDEQAGAKEDLCERSRCRSEYDEIAFEISGCFITFIYLTV